MPHTTEKLTIDPGGVTMTVDILDSAATSITCYTTRGGASTHTLPLSISTATAFHITTPGDYTISAKVNGEEVASGAGGTAVVSLHGADVTYPVTLQVGELSPDRFSVGATVASTATGSVAYKILYTDAVTGNTGYVHLFDA